MIEFMKETMLVMKYSLKRLLSGKRMVLLLVSGLFVLISMLMSMESPFAVLSAIVFYGITTGVPQLPTPYEWVGIALMFAAILISQYEPKKKTSQA